MWQQPHENVLNELREAGRLELSRVLVDASHVRALKGRCPYGVRQTAEAAVAW